MIGAWVFVAASLGLAAANGVAVGRAQEATPMTANHPLVGSWRLTGEFTDQGGSQPIGEVDSLVTFTADGNVLVANPIQLPAVPASAGLFFTEGQGAWASTGERGGDVTFVYLTLDQTGNLATTNTVRLRLEVDAAGDAVTGSFVLDTVSLSGGQFSPQAAGTLEATRIDVIPIDAPPATPGAGTPAP
jgi:hypothetical protein